MMAAVLIPARGRVIKSSQMINVLRAETITFEVIYG
jgi:hypothetical protein